MIRLLVSILCVLALGPPVEGQDNAERRAGVQELIEELASSEPASRANAAGALRDCPSAVEAVPALVQALRDPELNVRKLAAWTLRGVRNLHKASPTALAAAIGDPRADVRRSVIELLERDRRAARSVVEALSVALGDGDSEIRRLTATALGRVGVLPKAALDPLLLALHDVEPTVRESAAKSIESAALPGNHSVVAELVEALGDPEPRVREAAAGTLAVAGADSIAVVAGLVDATDDSDSGVRGRATEALRVIGNRFDRNGRPLLWVLPWVYWKSFLTLFCVLAGWFFVASRVPRHRPRGRVKPLGFLIRIAVIPAACACAAVYAATTQSWTQPFLPELPMALLPLPAAVTLSTGFLCLLASIWATYSKPVEEGCLAPE